MATKEESTEEMMDAFEIECQFHNAIQKIFVVANALHDGGTHDAGGHRADYYLGNSNILHEVCDELKEVDETLNVKSF